MSGALFITSDTHFGHRFVAGLRGFGDTDEHDRELVKR
jgi:calcineurin-like phosphoesterase family protein